MEVTKENKKENMLLHRTELQLEVSYEGATPSNAELKKMLAQKYKVDENAISIQHIYNEFGTRKSELHAFVYTDAVSKDKVEKINKKPKKQKDAKAAPAKK